MKQFVQSQNWMFKPLFDGEEGGMLIPLSNSGKHDLSQVVMLNPTASWVWEQMKIPMQADGLLGSLLKEFDLTETASPSKTIEDLATCLNELRALGAIEECGI